MRGRIVIDNNHLITWTSRLVMVALVLGCLVLMPVKKALAHPHVFIVQRYTLLFDEQGISGVKVRWKMDDMFAAMIAEEHDANGNGTLEPAEVKAVHDKAFVFIKKHSFFTFIKVDASPVAITAVKDFNATLNSGKLVYEFVVPCSIPADDKVKKVSVAGYDPTYYSAIFFANKNPVSLEAADGYELKTAIREDQDTKIYFDMIHPWTLFMELRKKS